MDRMPVLKAIADETRMRLLSLLLRHSYCVRALAGKLALSEGAVSQHLKVLREAGLLTGKRKGYFMHYDVNRDVLHELAAGIEALAGLERELCTRGEGGCPAPGRARCHAQKQGCHGAEPEKGGDCHGRHGHCHRDGSE